MRQLISFSLKRFKNARIIEAVDGVDALKKLSGPDKIDLILTDINMPVMDGLKLVSLVRQNAQLKSIPIIIITTEGAEEDRERGLALGANAYISKPIQSDRKSTRLNSSHSQISYAVFCLKKKKKIIIHY